ncbi:MAG: NADH-quinone oxidoreductase subunit C [Thermomicrobiales bacterium]
MTIATSVTALIAPDPHELANLVGGGLPLPDRVPGESRIEVHPSRLAHACGAIATRLGARLATMVGEDDRATSDTYRLSYVFAPPAGGWVTIETALSPRDPAFPSVTPLVPAANWYEREVHDLLGLAPIGHPDPRRLVLHDDWPAGVYPLRKDFDPARAVPTDENPPFLFPALHGDAILEIPVGPIHAGVIEPGHFRFAAVGEAILHLEPRLFYVHRGIEKVAEGKSPAHVLQIAERICGACSCSHAVAYCQAVELIAGCAIPARAAALRTVWLEMERLYNHIGDLGNICAGVGFAVGAALGAKLKDDLQRLNEQFVGNRFLHGACTIGGVRHDLSPQSARALESALSGTAAQFGDLLSLMMGSEIVVERLTGTGVLPAKVARDLAVVGVAARASGLDLDSRRDHPYASYDRLPLELRVPVRDEGDAMARALTRSDEAIVSFAIIRGLLANLPDGPIASVVGPIPGNGTAFSLTESPRGENLHWVQTTEDGAIGRYRVRSASYPNWPAVAAAVPGNMVPDFPLINKSFELCYACLDR